jgi:hypothetical protein
MGSGGLRTGGQPGAGPASKLAAAERVSCDVAVPGLVEMTEEQAYRAVGLLVEDTDAAVQEAVFLGSIRQAARI